MAKLVKREGLEWADAKAVLDGGGSVDLGPHWPGALRLRKRKDGGTPVYWVGADPTLPKAEQFNGHQWRPTEAEFQSTEWREVEFAALEDEPEQKTPPPEVKPEGKPAAPPKPARDLGDADLEP